MSPVIDATFACSRQNVVAGLVIRWVDVLSSLPVRRRGAMHVFAVPTDDVFAVCQAVAASRDWPCVFLEKGVSPTQCLRQLARLLDADRTGNRNYLTTQIHAALKGRQAVAVVVVAGTSALNQSASALEHLTGHPMLMVIVLTDACTAGRLQRYGSRVTGLIFKVTTVAERERLGRVVYRFGRWQRKRRLAARE